jgi:hypothetical protein
MIGPFRSPTVGTTLAVAMLLVAHSGQAARAQIFDYAIKDPGNDGSLGAAVTRLGDIDFDGAGDFAVGEPNFTYGGPNAGSVRLISGLTGSQIAYFVGDVNSNLGAAIDGEIDVDGDGFKDVLFGAPLDDYYAPNGGGAGAYSPRLNSFPFVYFGIHSDGKFGSSIQSLQHDLDKDGIDDFIVGEPGNDASYVISSAGKVLLFMNTGQAGSNFGTSVCRGGDLDGDGLEDYLVGNPDFVDSFGNKTGRITAFKGKDGTKLWSIDGQADSNFGKSIALPGDLDGDGQGDILVGAPKHLDPGSNPTGCVTAISGATQAVLYRAYGDNSNDNFGHDVHGTSGDIDQDGTIDFIAGAPQLSGSDVGYARTISGATGKELFTFTEHTNDPSTKSDYGIAVCGGDWNNDGRTDVVIGGSNFKSGDGIAETWITAVAHWKNYGKGWAGTSGVPAFLPLSDPVVGKSLKLNLDNSAGVKTAGLLVLGFSEASIKTGKGGTLLVTPFDFIPLSLPAGGLTLSGKVPDDPSLYGLDLYLQALELDGGASKGISFTRGLDLFFGYD